MFDTYNLKDLIAFGIIIFWPVIPLFWIPVHLMTDLFRKLGLTTYILSIFAWLPIVYFLYLVKDALLFYRVLIPSFLSCLGWVLFIPGLILHFLTGVYLRFGLIGIPEISDKIKIGLVKKGPFAVTRHPTYLAHTMIFVSAFLISGVLAVAFIAILDFLIVQLIIIPFEERELQNRFGDKYLQYMKKVPKFLPKIKF